MKKSRYATWSGLTGDKHCCWRGGRHVAWNGYVRVLRRDHPRALSNGYVWEHILVMEEKLGRPLKYAGKRHPDNETVHHIDHDKTNNHPDNLEVLGRSAHSKREWEDPLRYPQSKETRKKNPERYKKWLKSNKRDFWKKG